MDEISEPIDNPYSEFENSSRRYLAHYISLIHQLNQIYRPFHSSGKSENENRNITGISSREGLALLDQIGEELPNFLLAFEWVKKLEIRRELCKLADELSTFLNLRSHWIEWLWIAKLAVQEAELSQDPKLIAIAGNNLAVVLRQLEYFNDAMEYSRKSLFICQVTRDLYGEGLAYGNLAGAYFGLGELTASQSAYEKAQKIFRELGDMYEESQSLMGLGIVQAKSKRIDDAVSTLHSCIELQQETGDEFGEAQALNNLGITFRMQGKYQQAIECIQKSIQLKRRISDRQGIALAMNNLAVTYRDMKAYDFAISAWEEAIELISDINPTDMEQFTERLKKVQDMKRPVTGKVK